MTAQLECDAAESSPSAQVTEQSVGRSITSLRCRGVGCAAHVGTAIAVEVAHMRQAIALEHGDESPCVFRLL